MSASSCLAGCGSAGRPDIPSRVPDTEESDDLAVDAAPARAAFLRDVLEGLRAKDRSIPSKYLYDRRGSQLFEAICELDEYYLTRAELAILKRHAREIAQALGPRCLLVEYGSGSSLKTRLLLDALASPAGYVPIDISRTHLLESVEALRKRYPELEVLPVCADYDAPIELPRSGGSVAARVVYFPGSTIGNFTPDQAEAFLRRCARVIGERGGALIGFDRHKERARLEAAYDDSKGISAAFAKNLLERMNRELGSDFEPDEFRYEAPYDPDLRRIEMRLVSEADQVVRIGDTAIELREGDRIRTEYSHKFTAGDVAALAASAGLELGRSWTDPEALFSLSYLTLRS